MSTLTIGKKTKAEILKQIGGLFDTYQAKIETAYLATEEIFTIDFKVRLSPKGSATKVKTAIGFVESKVSDSAEGMVEEKQLPLGEEF